MATKIILDTIWQDLPSVICPSVRRSVIGGNLSISVKDSDFLRICLKKLCCSSALAVGLKMSNTRASSINYMK